MEEKFDLLITADRNMHAQQNLSGRTISILVLPPNRRKDVLVLGQRIADVVETLSAGQYAVLEKSGTLSRIP